MPVYSKAIHWANKLLKCVQCSYPDGHTCKMTWNADFHLEFLDFLAFGALAGYLLLSLFPTSLPTPGEVLLAHVFHPKSTLLVLRKCPGQRHQSWVLITASHCISSGSPVFWGMCFRNLHSVVEALCFHCRGAGLIPALGTRILHAAQCHQKNKWIKIKLTPTRKYTLPTTTPLVLWCFALEFSSLERCSFFPFIDSYPAKFGRCLLFQENFLKAPPPSQCRLNIAVYWQRLNNLLSRKGGESPEF